MRLTKNDLYDAPLLNTPGLSRDLGTVMIVAPHPDDESLGCGALIAHLRDQQATVWVLFMTNGEASHPNSRAFPPEKLGSLRRKEAIKACETLGVSREYLIFLNAGDGKLADYSDENNPVSTQLSEIFRQKNIDTLFVPWRRDHHIDHLATTRLVKDSIKDQEMVVAEYPVWLLNKGKEEDWPRKKEMLPFRLAVGELKHKKEMAINAHESQTTEMISDDPDGFILTRELLEPFLGDFEYFLFPSEPKPGIPESYFDELYSEDDDPWDFETSPYEKRKYKTTLAAIPEKEYTKALEIGCSNGVFTSMFAPECKSLLALDLNDAVLGSAKNRCKHLAQCEFLKWDVSQGLPGTGYDIIVLSEVGYYFEKSKLRSLYKNIQRSLLPGGILVMVHWTAYVRQYPLTGRQVHEIFTEKHDGSFNLISSQREELYELMVWEKLEK
ncbi:bifunctional PIG-L family deacetylase/class I SAM-dependent methyltransferase [Christiangramia echinicola]|uniref:N-acetylglucosaminyl deacetylase, LmbE family n=1 Tax=Christiangramia echinicola TaxID=279359 RepID=A0A1H1MGM3_9FLAO|nr:bifunctional PIG-L family deacetylase/class I SAM-dependent methyltransferase [Christiangramia echinicola]SDR85800.1 N-acetylglucosaminyl deacetylase, LmbE family [Christiangramia echinicola]